MLTRCSWSFESNLFPFTDYLKQKKCVFESTIMLRAFSNSINCTFPYPLTLWVISAWWESKNIAPQYTWWYSCAKRPGASSESTERTWHWWVLKFIMQSSIKYCNNVMTCQVSCDEVTIIEGCYCKLTRTFSLFTGTFDVVVVNLYPFYDKVTTGAISFEDGIENIDIGGPTLIRAAAKVAVLEY